jgi:deoxyribose-phosphate aldolase
MNINEYIDHTLLRPEATEAEIERLCREAREHRFASVCVNPCHTALVSERLKETSVKTCVVIGFPLGANATETKVFEANKALQDGAEELDMVINLGALRSGRLDMVQEDISAVAVAAKGALLKVIIECSLLTESEKETVSRIAVSAGAHFVKTSTGFSTGGATVEDVKLIRQVVGPSIGVKASGGIRDYQTAVAMIEAGASRLGTSAGVTIVEQAGGE